jgi:hypothetical protein
MARSGDLAGLAALGALGYLMNRRQDGSNVPVEDRSNVAAPIDNSGAFYEAGSGPTGQALASNAGPMDDESQWGTPAPGQVGYKKPIRRPMQPTAPATLPGQGRPATGPVTFTQGANPNYPGQGRPATGPVMFTQGARYGADAIPGQLPSVKAPTGGQRVDNPSEFRRLMEAAGPARLTGIGNLATELGTMGRVQRAYNTRAALRRAEEGLSPAEAAAAKARLREAAFEGGMKKGGKVKPKPKAKAKPKKMASGGMTSRPNASKRADGIATKGHTKCKMR